MILRRLLHDIRTRSKANQLAVIGRVVTGLAQGSLFHDRGRAQEMSMALAYCIALTHAGRITAGNADDRGADIVLTLPRREP